MQGIAYLRPSACVTMPPPTTSIALRKMSTFASNGFAIVPGVCGPSECDAICQRLAKSEKGCAGTRSLLQQDWCRRLAVHLRTTQRIAEFLPHDHVAVQCTFFEKSSTLNWLVPVHQDLSIPVAERVESAELKGWSRKESDLFVQPPVTVLEQLLAVRLHLDDCGEADGPLRVVPGSHKLGRIDAHQAPLVRQQSGEHVCTAPQGSALLMRPLLLHASSKSTGTSARRVLHFLYGPKALPFGLQWREAV